MMARGSLQRSMCRTAALLAGAVLWTGVPTSANAQTLSVANFVRLAQKCAPIAAPETLASIARVESDFDPLMISDNTSKHSFAPGSVSDATRVATQLIAAGHSVDVGLMQINCSNFRRAGLTVSTALDPCQSLAVGAAILAADYGGGVSHASQQAALRIALSRYNTGDAGRGFANGYVRRIEQAAQRVVPAIDLMTNGSASAMPSTPDRLRMPPRPGASAASAASGGADSWLVWADSSVIGLAKAPAAASAAVTNYPLPKTR
jgi:type IV secretion system protein VirB1